MTGPIDTTGGLTHLDPSGDARMVDVGAKAETRRVAIAAARIEAAPETIALLARGGGPKGDVFAVARIAAIQAAKKTGDLIPLCHSLPLDVVDVAFMTGPTHVEVVATAATTARTGVEMEAMVAASIAALTIYDMAKAVDRAMRVSEVALIEKRGGRSGLWRRDDAPPEARG